MIIAFWSPFRNIGTTASAIAVSAAVAMNKEHTSKSLLLHSSPRKSLIEHAYNLGNQTMSSEKGIEAVHRISKMGLLKKYTLRDYSDSVIKKRLDILSVHADYSQENYEWKGILQHALEDYAFTFLDIQQSSDWNTQKYFLQNVDLIVVMLPQDLHKVESYVQSHLPPVVKDKKHVFMLSQYDPDSNLSVKTLNRMPSFKKKIFLQLPYVTKYKDAINNSKGQEFFFRTFIREEKDHELQRFRKDLAAVAKHIHQERYFLTDTEERNTQGFVTSNQV